MELNTCGAETRNAREPKDTLWLVWSKRGNNTRLLCIISVNYLFKHTIVHGRDQLPFDGRMRMGCNFWESFWAIYCDNSRTFWIFTEVPDICKIPRHFQLFQTSGHCDLYITIITAVQQAAAVEVRKSRP